MRQLRTPASIGLALSLMCACASRAQSDLEIQIGLTKSRILLGEPVWVDVRVTNKSQQLLYVPFGAPCPGLTPLKIVVPTAEPGDSHPVRCAWGIMGSCPSSPAPEVQPGASITTRYVLEGNFRITHAGHYEILLEDLIHYGPVADGNGLLKLEQAANRQMELDVEPPDPARLLLLEQELAYKVVEPSRHPTQHPTDQEYIALVSDLTTVNATAEGLSKYPAAGMETVFRTWIENRVYGSVGLQALKQLNTPAAREALAAVAVSLYNPIGGWHGLRWQAVEALADLGDKSYLPLLERLTGNSDKEVRLNAILGLGSLGGEGELELLTQIAHKSASEEERGYAIRAIGETASLKAVPILIDLVTLPEIDVMSQPAQALRVVTHLNFPQLQSSPLETKRSWEAFWATHRRGARAYGEYECSGFPLPPGTRPNVESLH